MRGDVPLSQASPVQPVVQLHTPVRCEGVCERVCEGVCEGV